MNISEVISLYLAHKRVLGRRFRSEEAILRSFGKATGNEDIDTIREEVVLSFLYGKGAITRYTAKKYQVLSGLYRYAHSHDLVKISPLPRTFPKPISTFVPYIYSHEELKRLVEAVPGACEGRSRVEKEVYRTLLLLLYGTGLRLGEALALTLDDVDLPQGCLYIHESKFFKSRLVPMGKDLTKLMTDYVLIRRGQASGIKEVCLFCFSDGSPLSQSGARHVFRRLRLRAGVFREGGPRNQPRLHDLRHTFALHRLIAWYRNGEDLQALLPRLATYMGHVDLSATQRYLTLTPELLQLASQRFEHYAIGE